MNNIPERTLQELNANSDLLELLIEVQLCSLKSHEVYVELEAKLQRIRDKRNGITRLANGRKVVKIG